MLEEILVECILDMIYDPNMLYSFREGIDCESIRIISHRKEKLGFEFFYVTLAIVDENKSNFYVSQCRMNRIINERRSSSIDSILGEDLKN